MRLFSEAFLDGGTMPMHHTIEGENLSPPLSWENPPKEAKSFVLLFDDRDASLGSRAYWAAYDIPGYHCGLSEGAGRPAGFEDFRHAVNDFGRLGYSGPQRRHNGAHHYEFQLLALNCAELLLRTHPSCAEVAIAARPHILARARLWTTFVPERAQGAHSV